MQDSQGQMMALAFRYKSFKPVKLFPLRSEAAQTVRLELLWSQSSICYFLSVLVTSKRSSGFLLYKRSEQFFGPRGLEEAILDLLAQLDQTEWNLQL